MSEELTEETKEIIKLYEDDNLNDFKERLLNERKHFNDVFIHMLDNYDFNENKDLVSFLKNNFNDEMVKVSERIYTKSKES